MPEVMPEKLKDVHDVIERGRLLLRKHEGFHGVIYATKSENSDRGLWGNWWKNYTEGSVKYILADNSISKQMSVTLINQARKEDQDKHKAQLQELEKRLIDEMNEWKSTKDDIESKKYNRAMDDAVWITAKTFKDLL